MTDAPSNGVIAGLFSAVVVAVVVFLYEVIRFGKPGGSHHSGYPIVAGLVGGVGAGVVVALIVIVATIVTARRRR